MIGMAEPAKAKGLNHPPSTFLSSASPTKNAIDVVIMIAKTSTDGKKA